MSGTGSELPPLQAEQIFDSFFTQVPRRRNAASRNTLVLYTLADGAVHRADATGDNGAKWGSVLASWCSIPRGEL